MNLLYAWLTRDVPEKEKAKFDHALNAPPPEAAERPISPAVLEADAAAWHTAAASYAAVRGAPTTV